MVLPQLAKAMQCGWMKAKRLANICSIREAVFDNILQLNFKLCIKDLSSILHIVKPLMWYNLDQFRYFFITTNFESEEFAIFDQRLKGRPCGFVQSLAPNCPLNFSFFWSAKKTWPASVTGQYLFVHSLDFFVRSKY